MNDDPFEPLPFRFSRDPRDHEVIHQMHDTGLKLAGRRVDVATRRGHIVGVCLGSSYAEVGDQIGGAIRLLTRDGEQIEVDALDVKAVMPLEDPSTAVH